MCLKQLKLAGFKSFVDPTVVSFASSLVAIVGPNGCGKSNIIDAVRWVLGESSAKNLRGESMTDVIFNGSSARKSVGQASVELIFDNSLNRFSGFLGSYTEISVKRVVTRDGESSYYLNGSRCRRRDITDIFLGTGSGAKGYSIISQGTISRLIEAKPEELRAFLEEAAGVSKYKDRRRETLQRIDHTRDNLSRIGDLRDELDKQLQRLERQAQAAQRYTTLKKDEKRYRAEIVALKWHEHTEQQKNKQQELQELALQYEQQSSVLTALNLQQIQLNDALHNANEQSQDMHKSWYQLGVEITRLQESMQHHAKEKNRLEQDKQTLQEDWDRAQAQLVCDKEALHNSQQQVADLEGQLHTIRLGYNLCHDSIQKSRADYEHRQTHWLEIQKAQQSIATELRLNQVGKDHLESNARKIHVQLEQLAKDQEQESLVLPDMQHRKIELEHQHARLQELHMAHETQLKIEQERGDSLQIELNACELQLHQCQDDFHKYNSEWAALIATQKAARQAHITHDIPAWEDKSRLMDLLQVQPEWQSVCELILADSLFAYVLDDIQELWSAWDSCEPHSIRAVTCPGLTHKPTAYPCLADKVIGPVPSSLPILKHIYTADNLEQVQQWLPQLQPHESIVTKHGFWIGPGWFTFLHSKEHDAIGYLERQQKIAHLSEHVEALKQKIAEIQGLRDALHTQLQQSMNHIKTCQMNREASQEALRNNISEIQAIEHTLHQSEKHTTAMSAERDALHHSLEDLNLKLLEVIETLHQLEQQAGDFEKQHLQSLEEKHHWDKRLETDNVALERFRFELHETEKHYERDRAITTEIINRIARENEHSNTLKERLEQLALLCLEYKDPLQEEKQQLEDHLIQYHDLETQLTESRQRQTELKSALEANNKALVIHEQNLKQTEDRMTHTRMQEHELAVRASAFQESLDELQLQAVLLLEAMGGSRSREEKETELLNIQEKIKRLGAINLAAVEEFTTEQQRKVYLDEQYHDLNEALATLELAINKMDNETRLRLEHTFNEINNAFKTLFPRLFGGGCAQLELTCDNLLEAGIVVMAQPPGKRNSTIHLLSGGEKAMTAVALVFAMFQLNPSPFCMLDEVDAPLDDVNVGRFCDLVKEMSQFVQFLFITHNKVTMELADHLIGVTMREPGVSRLVAVDVKEALTME